MDRLIEQYPEYIKQAKNGGTDIFLDKNNLVHIALDGSIVYQFQKKFKDRASYIESVRKEMFSTSVPQFANWLLTEFCSVENMIQKYDPKYVYAHIKRMIKPKALRDIKIVTFGKKHRDTVEDVEFTFTASLLNIGSNDTEHVMSSYYYERTVREMITLIEVNEYKTIGIYSYTGTERAKALAELLKKEFYPRAIIEHLEIKNKADQYDAEVRRMKSSGKLKKKPHCIVTIKPDELAGDHVKIEFMNREGDVQCKFLYDKRVGSGISNGVFCELPTRFFIVEGDKIKEVEQNDATVIRFIGGKKIEKSKSLGTIKLFGDFTPALL